MMVCYTCSLIKLITRSIQIKLQGKKKGVSEVSGAMYHKKNLLSEPSFILEVLLVHLNIRNAKAFKIITSSDN